MKINRNKYGAMKKVFLSFYILIVASILLTKLAISPLLLEKFAETYLRDQTVEYNRKLAQGVYYLLEQDLLRLPQNAWADRVKELQPRFGYGIALSPLAALPLTTKEQKQLRQGQIVVTDKAEYLYRQIGTSDLVLAKGPLSTLQPDTGNFTLYCIMIITVILAPLTVLCLIPHWRNLRKISAAATAFGNGHFNVRAEISPRSSLAPIAGAFNTMAERIQQLIGSHKELTNGVSHELRTPISRIRFGLEMLESSPDPDKRQHYSQGLQTDIEELEDLVTELLTFARFDREKPELHFSVQDLQAWLSQFLAESLPADGPVPCRVVFKIKPPCQVSFEPKYLARALGNLIQNGLRYAQQRLSIIIEQDGDNCCIHIDDDGPGIPPEDRAKIFEPFTRLDASRNRASGGYGLGLAIVARIIAWHSGRVAVDDSPLGGARFSICWPGFAAR